MSKGRKANPVKRANRRTRTRSHIAKDLLTVKYAQKIVPDEKKESSLRPMTHKELVQAIQEEEEFRC